MVCMGWDFVRRACTNGHQNFPGLCRGGATESGEPLPEKTARRFFQQVISGLEYVHSLGIAHRDLKLENILLDGSNNCKICDFGFSKMQRDDLLSTPCGTLSSLSMLLSCRLFLLLSMCTGCWYYAIACFVLPSALLYMPSCLFLYIHFHSQVLYLISFIICPHQSMGCVSCQSSTQ